MGPANRQDKAPDARVINLETAVTTSPTPWPRKGINYRMHPGGWVGGRAVGGWAGAEVSLPSGVPAGGQGSCCVGVGAALPLLGLHGRRRPLGGDSMHRSCPGFVVTSHLSPVYPSRLPRPPSKAQATCRA